MKRIKKFSEVNEAMTIDNGTIVNINDYVKFNTDNGVLTMGDESDKIQINLSQEENFTEIKSLIISMMDRRRDRLYRR